MATTERPLTLTTPLNADDLWPTAFTCREEISRLFELRIDLLAPASLDVAFDKLLGQPVTLTVAMPGGGKRHVSGIVCRISQGETDNAAPDVRRRAYRMEVVPQFWLLTRRSQSRIFQQKSVPDILKAVLAGLDVSFETHGTFHPRDYCAQYRETDFEFASRLMEEEGIFYFFKHAAGGHKMVISNSPISHPAVPGAATVRYEPLVGGARPAERVTAWEKTQELTPGKYTLWDHCFELPGKNLEATKAVQATVQAGTVTHKLALSANDRLEIYDWPGEYAQRFDGVASSGGDQPAELQKIFEDGARTVQIRVGEGAARGITVRGASDCRQLTAGHKFTLAGHGDGNGGYVLTAVEHAARAGSADRAGGGEGFTYSNTFTCIPDALPYRPPRATPRPRVDGCQTAVVVGPPGEEIYPDKYGRVKVQFAWDREGKKNVNSSCWVRVASTWAGRQWGAIHIPRIGQEVVVAFEEGDPDRPIVVGSVYNAENMPPYALPANKTQSGVKSRSSLGGTDANFNELRFEDKKGSEQVYLHAEKNMDTVVEHDETVEVGNDRTENVGKNETITIGNDRTESVAKNETLSVGENQSLSVGKNQSADVGENQSLSVGKNRSISVTNNQTTNVGGSRSAGVDKDDALSVTKKRTVSVGTDDTLSVGKKLVVEAGDEIVLKTGNATIVMKKDGTITISGKDITIKGSGKVNVKASSDVVVKGSKVLAN